MSNTLVSSLRKLTVFLADPLKTNGIVTGYLGRRTLSYDHITYTPENELPFVSEDPYLITAPNMLIQQWVEEAGKFLDKSAWQLLVYPRDARGRDEFWSKTWKKAGKASRIIVFAAHSVSVVRKLSDQVRRCESRNGRSLCRTRCDTRFGCTWH